MVCMKLLDADTSGNDDVQMEASVLSSYSQNVCSSIVKDENNIDQSTNIIDKGSVAVDETRVHEKESLPKHSETSHTSPGKRSAEVKNDGTNRQAL